MSIFQWAQNPWGQEILVRISWDLLWAALIGWLVFAEFPDIWTWLGGAVIFAASLYLARRSF